MKRLLTCIKFIIISVAFTSLAGCGETDIEPEGEMAVIEGWISSDGYPTVIFTSSINPDGRDKKLSDAVVRWGRVSISDGERTVVLTAGPDDDYFPPYRYYNYRLKGEPGRTYTIKADYKRLHAEASCTMPFPTEIDRIEVEPLNDSLRGATLYFRAPEDCPAYYYVTLRSDKRRSRPYPAMLGIAEALQPGAEISIPLYRPKNRLDTLDFVPNFKKGERYLVDLNRIDKKVYDFWRSYNELIVFGGSQFVSTSSELVGNIKNGYGVWSAQGTSTRQLDIE